VSRDGADAMNSVGAPCRHPRRTGESIHSCYTLLWRSDDPWRYLKVSSSSRPPALPARAPGRVRALSCAQAWMSPPANGAVRISPEQGSEPCSFDWPSGRPVVCGIKRPTLGWGCAASWNKPNAQDPTGEQRSDEARRSRDHQHAAD